MPAGVGTMTVPTREQIVVDQVDHFSRYADHRLEGPFLIGQGREAAALIDLQNFIVSGGGAFHGHAIVERQIVGVTAAEKNINRLFAGHGFIFDGRNPIGIAAWVHGGNRLLEFVQWNMPFGVVGEQRVAFVEIFFEKDRAGKFEGARGGQAFVMLDGLGTGREGRDERQHETTHF
jgi:hypothetical protein